MRRTTFAALCAALCITVPAQAGCWSSEHAKAAHIRDLQTYLMVETLRCHMIGFDITPQYDAFVRGNRNALGDANDHLKTFFIGSDGPVYGQQSYDRFTTSLANAYGAEHTNAESCAMARSTAAEAAQMAGSPDGLLMIASRQGLTPALPGGRCDEANLAEVRR